MLESTWMLLMNGLLLMLRVMPGDSFPKPLSREKEAEYVERWLTGDIEARNLLVEHNLRLVAHIVKKYYQNEDADDLISIGSIGLIKGINTYRPDRGVRLATYASRCIENEILMHFRAERKRASDVSLSDALDGGEPLPQRTVAQRFGISRSYVSRIEKRALEKLRSTLSDPSES